MANRGAQRQKRFVRDLAVRVWHQLVTIAKKADEAERDATKAEDSVAEGDYRKARKRTARASKRAERTEKDAMESEKVSQGGSGLAVLVLGYALKQPGAPTIPPYHRTCNEPAAAASLNHTFRCALRPAVRDAHLRR